MTTTTLVLSFLDDEGNEANISVKNPKSSLARSTVTDVMDTIIENGAILSSKGNALDAVNDCYYKAVTTTALTDAGQGE